MGTKVPRNEGSWVRKFQGTNFVPGNESSLVESSIIHSFVFICKVFSVRPYYRGILSGGDYVVDSSLAPTRAGAGPAIGRQSVNLLRLSELRNSAAVKRCGDGSDRLRTAIARAAASPIITS